MSSAATPPSSPLYSLMLGLLAMLGFMAIAADVKVKNGQLAIPQLFADVFPDWFTGVAFAAIGIGALVPAAIMSIAAANLFTRNIYKDFLRPDASPAQEAKVSKIASLLVKVGALAFVLTMDKTVAINFQLLGGIWILQTVPALVGGLFTRWCHRWALLAGWAAGMTYGTWRAYDTPQRHSGSLRQHQPDPVHRREGLHRADRLRPQRARRDRGHVRPAGREGPRRRRPDQALGLHRRRGRPGRPHGAPPATAGAPAGH
ncbi:hypothetical protein GCM10020000_26910 [Streptomyces olivoverticillatus]